MYFCEAADSSFSLKSCFYLFPTFFTQDTQKSQYFHTILKYSILFPFIPPICLTPLFPSPLTLLLPVPPLLHFVSLSLFFIPPSPPIPRCYWTVHIYKNYQWKFFISLWNHTPPFCFSFDLFPFPPFISHCPSILLVSVLIPPPLSPSLLKEQPSSPLFLPYVIVSSVYPTLAHVLHLLHKDSLGQCGGFSVPQSGFFFFGGWWGGSSFQDLLLMDI